MASSTDVSLILINPVQRSFNGNVRHSEQLGLLYIATYIKSLGYKTQILSGEISPTKLLSEIESRDSLKLIGLYVNSDNIQEVLRISHFCKEHSPATPIILGGPIATASHKELIKHQFIDYVCRREGEHLTAELLNTLKLPENQRASHLSRISGLTYKDCAGTIIVNEDRPFIQNLDSLPILDRSLDTSTHGKSNGISAGRGCGQRCTFCFESTDRKIRLHSAQRIIDEIKSIQKNSPTDYISFCDDSFISDINRVYEFCDLIDSSFSENERFHWFCEARVDTISNNPELLPKMVKAGLVRLQVGTESGSQKVLDAYRKNITLEQVYKAIKIANDCNLPSVFTNFIIGGAHETREVFEQSLKFAKDLIELAPGVVEISCSFLSPYPATDIYLNPQKYDLEIIDENFYTGVSDDYLFAKPIGTTRNELLDREKEFIATVNATMKSVIPNLSKEVIARQLNLIEKGVVTNWSALLQEDIILRCWKTFISNNDHIYNIDNLSDEECLNLTPVRVFSIRCLEDGELKWETMNKVFEFEGFERFIIDHCAGKLTISELSVVAQSYWENKVDIKTVSHDIINFLKSLSDEFLVVFRKGFRAVP